MGTIQKPMKMESIDPFDPLAIEPQGSEDSKVAPTEDPNATDYSTSFDDSLSGTESCAGMSDDEVESSQFYGSDSFPFDGFNSMMLPTRKKKLSCQWRNYIRPLTWRCKWAQLKMMQFRSQASKYEREIARHEKRMQQNLTSRSRGERPIKRSKRKRVEDDPADVASFLSQHNLFSYVENKKAEQDGSSVIEEFGNPVIAERNSVGREGYAIQDEISFHENNDNTDFIGEMLQNIEETHSRVQRLKSRLITVLEENCMNFSSSEDMSLLIPSATQSPNLSTCNGDTSSLGAFLNEIGDFVVPHNMGENFGVPFLVPDIIESTASLLSSIDVTMLHPEIGDSCEAIMDNVQLQDEAAERERIASENINKQSLVKKEAVVTVKEESNKLAPISASENGPVSETVTPNEQSNLASGLGLGFNFLKRKRGERKAGSGGWHL